MPYLHILRRPSVFRLLTGSWVGRLPSAMAALAVPLALRDAGASYGFVGLAAGTFALSAAVGAPLVGRLIDRRGQTLILLITAVLAAAGFITIALTPDQWALVLLGAAVAGAATPPLEPCLRTLWPGLVPPDDLESAYALDSSAQELVFVAGPLVVAGTVAVVSPAAVLWVQAALGIVGVLVVATAGPSRRWRTEVRSTDWLGPLRERGLVLLLACLAGVGFAIGTLNILVVHYAEQRTFFGGSPGLLALHAAGSLAGVLVYGAVRWKVPLPRRALALALGLLTGYGLLIFLPPPPLMGPADGPDGVVPRSAAGHHLHAGRRAGAGRHDHRGLRMADHPVRLRHVIGVRGHRRDAPALHRPLGCRLRRPGCLGHGAAPVPGPPQAARAQGNEPRGVGRRHGLTLTHHARRPAPPARPAVRASCRRRGSVPRHC
ncbi:MFS transporter [Streptomyces flavovirens]|uniref:MFS transporter n=1 Tax=Streptomyces flavovirens TaxID=52258 RepID=UPI0031E75B95